MLDEIDLTQFLPGFVSEAIELLRVANVSLIQLESAAKKGATQT